MKAKVILTAWSRAGAALLLVVLLLAGCGKPAEPPALGIPETTGEEAAVVFPEGPVLLKANWQVGRRYRMRQEVRQHSQTKFPMREAPTRQRVVMTQDYVVDVLEALAPAGRQLEVEYLSSAMEIVMNDKLVLAYDSQREESGGAGDPIKAALDQIKGLRMRLVLDGSNKLDRVEGLQEFNKQLTKNLPEQSRIVLTNLFATENFKLLLEVDRDMPDTLVTVGDVWPASQEVPMGQLGLMHAESEYTFKGWEAKEGRPCALLEVTGVFRSRDDEVIVKGMKLKIEQGKLQGRVYVDPVLGMTVEQHVDQSFTVTLTANLPKVEGQPVVSTAINMDFRQTLDQMLLEVVDL